MARKRILKELNKSNEKIQYYGKRKKSDLENCEEHNFVAPRKKKNRLHLQN